MSARKPGDRARRQWRCDRDGRELYEGRPPLNPHVSSTKDHPRPLHLSPRLCHRSEPVALPETSQPRGGNATRSRR